MFLGEKNEALLKFFREFFDKKIEFSRTSGIFYYPYKISSGLIRVFAAFPASLELIVTPKEYTETDCIVLVINMQNQEHFGDFVPFYQAILEKKLNCPPIIIIGLTTDQEKPRQISYFGMVALKSFICKTFKPADAHFLEWNLHSSFNGIDAISNIFQEMLPIIDKTKIDAKTSFPRNLVKPEVRRLIKEMQEWKFLDKQKGLKHLIEDEHLCMHGGLFSSTRFKGYNRDLLIRHGLDPAFVKDILDAWESWFDDTKAAPDFIEAMKQKFPDYFDESKKFLAPRCLATLVADHGLDIQPAKSLLKILQKDESDIDLHHTQSIVEEMASITELIIIFGSQPVFYHFPNKKMGIGSMTNIDMLSGMFQVLDIMRSQVYISELDEKKAVEKIKYGSLNLTIAHGKRAKCIIHSIRELTDDLLKKTEQYLDAFERVFQTTLDAYKGETNIFNEGGKKLYDDIFTPLPVTHINKNWLLKSFSEVERSMLTRNQLRVLDAITDMQQKKIIGTTFHIEDVFSQIAAHVRLSLSDLLLILPGELLELSLIT